MNSKAKVTKTADLKTIRVLCINAKPIEGYLNTELEYLKEGRVYAAKAIFEPYSDLIGYILNGITTEGEPGYSADRFIRLSDIDETVLLANRSLGIKKCGS